MEECGAAGWSRPRRQGERHMNSRRKWNTFIAMAAATVLIGLPAVAHGQDAPSWQVVASNGTVIPGTLDRTFNSYNDPSVNSRGFVVFRARSTGKQGGPIRGIFARDMGEGLPLYDVYLAQAEVPWPNNTDYNDEAGRFNEFPSFARVDAGSPTIVTRGQTQPTWRYYLDDGSETRVGTSGVYVEYGAEQFTAMTQLGAVPGFEYYMVPGAPLYTRLEQFPGAPSVMDRDTIAFKGNFSVGDDSYTGVYFRNFRKSGGMAPVTLVASSLTTKVPGTEVYFGSTAPPSAADGYMAFVGLDDEASPTAGGIYRASLKKPGSLETLVAIGDPVPGESESATFTRFGESLALGDQSRFVAFWGAWGEDVTDRTVTCPAEGNKARREFCQEVCAPEGTCELELPVHEGIFVYDTMSGSVVPVAKNHGDDGIDTFLYCKFSGRAPGTSGGCGGGSGHGGENTGPGEPGGAGLGQGEGGGPDDFDNYEDGELARWRCGAYVALASRGNAYYQVAYKAVRGEATAIDLFDSRPEKPVQTVLATGVNASVLDPEAPEGALITSLGIERDGFRKGWMAVTAGMLVPTTEAAAEAAPDEGDGHGGDGHADEAEGWAGIYLTRIPGWADEDESD